MDHPATNVAVLFADVSSSTQMYDLLGNADAQATIERCLAIARRACEEWGGRIIKTIGDEIMAAFPAPDAAAHATMHVGFHFGPAIENAGDLFGDSVNVASRLTELSGSGQIFTSAQTAAELSPAMKKRTRDQDAQTLRGKEQDIRVYELIWQDSEDELTMMTPRPAPASASAKVKLRHGTRDIELGGGKSVLTLGRDQQNDVVVADRKASRLHGKIERRRDKFVLIDHSSNGTYVTVEGEPEIVLRREELILRGRGRMSFGHAYADDPAEFLAFSCLD